MVDLEAPGALLLVHDGELADVRRLLDEFGLGFREISARSGDPGAYLAAGLVIATPQYLVDRVGAGDGSDAVRVAIMEGESRTLRSMLSRGGVDWIVRRPVHPAALQLLILHCLYNGPEKRKGTRVGMGVEVLVRSGWRGRRAILVEISERDCRLLSRHPVDVGARLKVRLPAEVVGRRALQQRDA